MKMTRRTVPVHVRLEEIFNNNNKSGGIKCPCLMIRRKSQTGGIKHTCQVITLESRSGVGEGPHLLIRQKPQSVQPSPPMPMQLMNTPCHSGVHSESNVLDHLWDWWNDDQQRQYGIVASRTGHQQNHIWDQWNRWNVDDWNRWSSVSAHGNDDGLSSRSQWYSEPKKYFDKSPPPEWDGNHPEKTWRDYRRTLKQWLSTTDVSSEKYGMLLWRALTGDAKLLISHFRDEDLLHRDAGQRIFDVLAQAHKQSSEFEDQDDSDNAFCKLHRERNQTLLQFANVVRAAYLKHDAYGYPLPDRTKGMISLRQAKIPGHLEDHIMTKTNGSRNFSDLLDAIQILARRPISQVSSSFPPYYDEWDDDDHDDVDNDGYYDEYDELEDHDNEWIDMSGIPEDATFE